MNRTLLLLILFLALGGVAGWFLLGRQDARTTMAGWDRDFAVADTSRIHRIFIADREGTQTTLERHDGYWLYNGRWRARPNAMENLLDAVRRVQMKYKPPQAMAPNMIRDLASHGIKVELYDRGGDLIKAYYVGGGTADERGTYMIREGAEQPYVAHIPGWSGNLRYRFSLRGEDWRDKTVFACDPEQIRAASIEYPKQRNKSFRLERRGRDFQVRPFYEITPVITRPYRRGSAEQFLAGFENLVAEAFENQNPRRDSVLRQVPFAVITVTDAQGQDLTARFFPINPPSSNTIERYFVDLSPGDFMLVQNRVFKRIFWAYDFFFEEQ